MKGLCLLLLVQVSVQLHCDKTSIQATVGSEFTITCAYQTNRLRFNKKYWCAGESKTTCEVRMDTDGFSLAKYRKRARIIDAVSRGLIVQVGDLQVGDAGIYWVGIDKIYADIMLMVRVTVTKEAVMKPNVWPLSSVDETCWGQPVTFRCRSERGTDVQYTWYRAGQPDNIVLHHDTDISFHCSNSIEITQFFCSASNDVSSQNSESLYVQQLQPANQGCVYLITSQTLSSYDCIQSTTTPSTTTQSLEKLCNSATHPNGGNQTSFNQTWTEIYSPRSLSGLPLWYECFRWLLLSAMITALCVVHVSTKSRPRRLRAQGKHHKDI